MQKKWLVLLLFLSGLVSSNQNANFDHEIKVNIKDIRSNFNKKNENFFLTILNGIKGQRDNYYSFDSLNDIKVKPPEGFIEDKKSNSEVTYSQQETKILSFCSKKITLTLDPSDEYFITLKHLDKEILGADKSEYPLYENTNLAIYKKDEKTLKGYLLLQGKVIIAIFEVCNNRSLDKDIFMLIDWLKNIRNENTK